MKLDYTPQAMAQIAGALNVKDFIKNSADRFKNNNTGDVLSGLSQLAAANAFQNYLANANNNTYASPLSLNMGPVAVTQTGTLQNTPYVNSAMMNYNGNNSTVTAPSVINAQYQGNSTIPQYSYF